MKCNNVYEKVKASTIFLCSVYKTDMSQCLDAGFLGRLKKPFLERVRR
jgi:hypothetical protein